MMVFGKRVVELGNIYSNLFLAFMFVLTIFSLVYSFELSSKNITGFTGEDGSIVLQISEASQLPSQEIIDSLSQYASQASQGASYASSINSAILQDPNLSQEELAQYLRDLQSTLSSSAQIYSSSSAVVSGYSSDELEQYYSSILQSIGVITDVSSEIGALLSNGVEFQQNKQEDQATWSVSRQEIVVESVEELEDYISEIIPSESIDAIKVLTQDSLETFSGDNCDYPSYASLFDDRFVDFGENGVDFNTGDICKIDTREVYDAVSSSASMRTFIIPELDGIYDLESLPETESVAAIHFESENSVAEKNDVGVVFFKDPNEQLSIKFFDSPNSYEVEQEISEFINHLFFNESDSPVSVLPEIPLQQVEEVIDKHKKYPITLWVILSIMLLSFLIFGRYLDLSSYNFKSNSLDTEKSNKPILEEYDKINKIGYDVSDNFSRVEKMIRDTLVEAKTSPKFAFARMPIIADSYKLLDSKSREKLAPLYESLVYSLRDLNEKIE